MPRAGQMNRRVTFQQEVAVADAGGGREHAWSGGFTVWGQFMPESGRERLEAGRLEAALAGVLRVRSSIQARTITASHRVLIDGAAHQIRSIANPDQRRRFIEFVVERGVAT